MTLTLELEDAGRTTVSLKWDREWSTDQPSSYQVYRCIAPALMERIATVVAGKRFIDPNCTPATTYTYRVATVGLPTMEDDTLQVTTRPRTEFPDMMAFFHDYLSQVFARSPHDTDIRWCPQWQRHKEAEEVVNALWRAYEAHRPPDDPLAPSTERAIWLNVYAYPLMTHLFDSKGGLKDCSQIHGQWNHVNPEFPPLAG